MSEGKETRAAASANLSGTHQKFMSTVGRGRINNELTGSYGPETRGCDRDGHQGLCGDDRLPIGGKRNLTSTMQQVFLGRTTSGQNQPGILPKNCRRVGFIPTEV